MSNPSDPDELALQYSEGDNGLAWGVEIHPHRSNVKTFFRSARRVILDGECVQLQLADGTYEAFPIHHVRKILAMRVEPQSGYTGAELSEDGIY